MVFSAVTEIMLYCPKCQSKYPAGSRRFCDNDGTRLSAAPNSATAPKPKSGGIFTNLIGRTAPTNQTDEKLASTPKFVPFTPKQKIESDFIIPQTSEPIKTEKLSVPELEIFEPQPIEKPQPINKPLARLIKPEEIASGTAEIGDRKLNPAGRTALNWEKPEILIGQTVKGRYEVKEILGKDEQSISYLAEDKIGLSKKVFIRVFIIESEDEDFSNPVFAEERVSLSHINHPNIARVIDSGELLEGNLFIVSEFTEGKTIMDMLVRTGQFNVMRTARIIRQASYGLSEAHQNGILHRNLKPANIVLDVSEAGIEQVKVTNFGGLSDKINNHNFVYKSPEQLEAKLANFASDIYSLAVIAYQMLTNRLPFNASSVSSLLKLQKAGLTILPTNLRLDVPPLVDDILTKAFSPNPSERYPKARDFGDAFFNALTTASPWEETKKTPEKAEPQAKEKEKNFLVIPPISIPQKVEETPTEEIILEIAPKAETIEEANLLDVEKVPETEAETEVEVENEEALPWEKRSPDTLRESSPNLLMFGIFALGLLVLAAVWFFILNQPAASPDLAQQNPSANSRAVENSDENAAANQNSSTDLEINEIPPPARKVPQPPNTIYFESSKTELESDLSKNFLGFSIFYPNGWTKNTSKTDFLDITQKSADGLPVKQILITRYESRGLFSLDKANFAKLVEKSNKDLKSSLPNYKVVSESETSIQNGRWNAYQVLFENSGTISKNGELTLWGRRLWIPIQRPGMKSGFVITIIATSLAPNIKNVQDLISDEELSQIMETFEPASTFN